MVHNFLPSQAKELSRTIGIHKPGKTVLLLGDSYARVGGYFRRGPSVYKISLVIVKEMLRRMPTVGIIDGANRFDAYGLARLAQAEGEEPSEILSRVFLSRIFTAFQMDGVVTRGVDAFLSRQKSEYSGHPSGVMIIFGLLDLYYDDEISVRESEKSFARMSAAFDRLKGNGVSALLVSENLIPVREDKRCFQSRLKAMADDIYEVNYNYLDGRDVVAKNEKSNLFGYPAGHLNGRENCANSVELHCEGVTYISEGHVLANRERNIYPEGVR